MWMFRLTWRATLVSRNPCIYIVLYLNRYHRHYILWYCMGHVKLASCHPICNTHFKYFNHFGPTAAASLYHLSYKSHPPLVLHSNTSLWPWCCFLYANPVRHCDTKLHTRKRNWKAGWSNESGKGSGSVVYLRFKKAVCNRSTCAFKQTS